MIWPLLAMAVSRFAAAPCAAAQDGDAVVLENKVLRIMIRKTPAPYVGGLVHKASGIAVVSGPAEKNFFTLSLLKSDGGQDSIGSYQAKESSVRLAPVAGGARIEMDYARFDAGDLSVRVVGTCEEKDPLTRWEIEISNNTGRALSQIRFPILAAVPKIGSPDDDVLVFPSLPGVLIENPARNWEDNRSLALRYPGDLSAQFVAYQDRDAGVYCGTMDPEGHPKSIGIVKRKEGFVVFHEFRPEGGGGKKWRAPYPAAVGVTQGSWCESADLYKAWAVLQPWCARTLAQREDVPLWWKQGPCVHVCEVRAYDAKRACSGSYYPRLPDHLRAFGKRIDGPIVAMLAGWENHRRWTAGDYFPVFDAGNAGKTIAEIQKEGFRAFFFLSGLFYTFENEGVDGSKIPAAEKYLPHFVVDEKTGKPRVFTLDESSAASTWKRHSYEFCAGSPSTREFFRGVIDRAHELGVDVLQMDQTVQGAGSACASAQHGHAPGPGLYQTKAFCELLREMRMYGKSKNKDFVLFHEEPHEQLIPCLDGFHVREYYEKRWYRGHPSAVGIPLFSYLYHEYAIGYGGDSAGLSKRNDPWLVRCHAMNLAAGRTPGAAIWSSHQSMEEAHPNQIKMIRNHGLLLKSRARDFLMLGKMLHPFGLDVPKIRYSIWTGRRQGPAQEEFEGPAVLTSSWQSPDGKVGHLFVNVSEVPQSLKVRLDARGAPTPCDAELFRSEDGVFKPLWQGASLPKEFAGDLAPLEALFLELRKSGRP